MDRLNKLLLWLLRKANCKGNFCVSIIDNVVGVLEWHLASDYAKKAAEHFDEDDPRFVDHHLRTFLLMLIAVMTCRDPNIKRMHKNVIRDLLVDFQAKMKENYPAKH